MSKFIDENISDVDKYESQNYKAEMILFKLDDKEYAFDTGSVCEIIETVEFTKVIYADEIIEGIINIRGNIVAIVSLYKKLNVAMKKSKDFKIIICDVNNTKIGFLVDSISDILKIKSNEIVEHESGIFSSMLHLNGGERLVLSIDVNKAISKERLQANG